MPFEDLDPMPLRPGFCDNCGARCGRNHKGVQAKYCSPDCRTAYRSLLRTQGAAVIQLLKIWRKDRGRSGSRGADAYAEAVRRIDELNARDRDRQKNQPPTRVEG